MAVRLFYTQVVPMCSEDAYISFHAAMDPTWRNAATSPLWCLWVGLFHHPEITATATSLLFDCLAIIAMGGSKSFWGFVLLWCLPFYNGSALGGLETHVAACCLVMGTRWKPILSISSALRPDTALMAFLVGGKRWRWPLIGAVVMVALNVWFSGGPLPSTSTSKAAVYGIQGLTYFWWYMVAPSAMLLAWLARRTPARVGFLCAALFFCFTWNHQEGKLEDRITQEDALWRFGEQFAALDPKGTVLMEPAGIIPYHAYKLRVVDEIGLVTPWVLPYRKRGPGWYVDLVDTLKPEWIVMRNSDYSLMNSGLLMRYSGGLAPARSKVEWQGMIRQYTIRMGSRWQQLPNGKILMGGRSSDLVALQRIY